MFEGLRPSSSPISQTSQLRFEIFGRRLFPVHGPFGGWMDETELRRVEHHARRRDEWRAKVSNVDALAEDRMSHLREVNSDLMRAPRLELHRDQRRSLQLFDRLDVRHRALSLTTS